MGHPTTNTDHRMLALILRFSAALAVLLVAILVLYLTSRNSRLEDAISTSTIEREQINAERDTAIAKVSDLTKELAAASQDVEAEKTKANSYYQQNIMARKEITRLSEVAQEAEETLNENGEEISRLKRQLIETASFGDATEPTSASENAEELKSRISLLEEEVELYRRHLGSRMPNTGEVGNSAMDSATMALSNGIEAEVLRFLPEKSIIAISIGRLHGIESNRRVLVGDSSGEIAEVEITQVRTEFCVGRVLAGFGQPERLWEGMRITVSTF